MTRKDARECAFKFIFEYEVQREDKDELLLQFFGLNPDAEDKQEYISSLSVPVWCITFEFTTTVSPSVNSTCSPSRRT